MSTDHNGDSRKFGVDEKHAAPDHDLAYYEAEAFALTASQVRALTARMIEEENQRVRRAMARLESKKAAKPDYVKSD